MAIIPLLTFSPPASARGLRESQAQPSSSSASLARLVDLNLRGRSFRYDINGYIAGVSQENVIGSGEVDTSSNSVQVNGTFGLASAGEGLSAGSSLPPGPSATFSLIETTQAEYVGGKLFASLRPTGATWASVDYDKLSQPVVSSANSVPSLEDNIYPMLQILRLPGAGVVVARSSSGTLDGSKLSYYKALITPSEVIKRINASTLPQGDKIQIRSVLGWSAMTCYIGFDSTGRLRQVQYLATVVVDYLPLNLDMVENMSRWPNPTRIGAPPANEVFDRTRMVNIGAARLNPGSVQTA